MKTILLISLIAFHAAADTSSLPKGVRAFVFKYINAQVGGKYSNFGNIESYDLTEKLTLDTVGGLSTKVNEVVNQIKTTSPEIFNNLEIGSIDVVSQIDVSANAFALAYGVTDKLMVAVAAPYMNAKVNLKGGYTDSGQLAAASKSLALMAQDPKYESNKENISILKQFISQLPTLETANLQDILVNYYGYKPIGSWEGAGFGDVIAFAQYRFFETSFYKTALKVQADIPTSGTKDPDNLVAVPLSSGYWGSSIESLNDFLPFGFDNLVLSLNPKFKYNWPTQATVRLPTNADFPLSRDKETLTWEPGAVVSLTGIIDLKTNNKFFGGFGQYTLSNKLSDTYRGSKANYDYSILSRYSGGESDVLELGIYLSTVNFYLSQKFPLPLKGVLSYSQVVSGINSDFLKLWNLSFEMYF